MPVTPRNRDVQTAMRACLVCLLYSVSFMTILIGPVAQWIRHRPTEPVIAGSSPAGVMFIHDVLCVEVQCANMQRHQKFVYQGRYRILFLLSGT